MQGGKAVDFIERTAMDAQLSSDEVRGIAARVQNQATYPNSAFANSLKLVAKLIGGGLPTRIYYVSQGGYDTHTNQLATQQRLLGDLGDSLKAFVDDMKAQGNMQRVLVMTFSEFGRRVNENANGGTDHGAAAPMFIVGNKVKAGLLGRYPSLAPQDLFQGDIKYNVDFRQRLCRRFGKLAQDEERAHFGQTIRAAPGGLKADDPCGSGNRLQPDRLVAAQPVLQF